MKTIDKTLLIILVITVISFIVGVLLKSYTISAISIMAMIGDFAIMMVLPERI